MSLKPLFSTYRQGENRVTASLLAVLSRLGTDLTERVLGALLDEPELSLVSFTPLPATKGAGNPDGEIRAQFRCLLEVKTVRGALASESAAALKAAYVSKLGDDPSARLIILTPDGRVPKPLEAVSDARVVWVSFVKLATALRDILDDQDESAGERERYLIRELMALFRVEGLIDALDTVVVAARRAYQLYLTYHAYACQPNLPCALSNGWRSTPPRRSSLRSRRSSAAAATSRSRPSRHTHGASHRTRSTAP
jgi:hypothetical protein